GLSSGSVLPRASARRRAVAGSVGGRGRSSPRGSTSVRSLSSVSDGMAASYRPMAFCASEAIAGGTLPVQIEMTPDAMGSVRRLSPMSIRPDQLHRVSAKREPEAGPVARADLAVLRYVVAVEQSPEHR